MEIKLKPHLYINSKGYFVTRHSYSGSESFNYCAQKYYLQRIQGWTAREDRAARHFGTALEHAVQFWHQHKMDTPAAVAEFVRLWAEHKEVEYTYSKTDGNWEALNLSGQELVRLYAVRYPTFPYLVNNTLDFQVETRFEVFPDTKLAGIEYTGYIDLVATRKAVDEPLIIDMKTSGKEVPEFTVLDPQLRSYAWAKGWPNVAFLWFRKMGRSISKGDRVTFLEPAGSGRYAPGNDATVLMKDDFGIWVTDLQDVIDEFDKIEGKSKAAEAARQKLVEEKAVHVVERNLTKQRVQFKEAVITSESAQDIGRSIKRDIINIAAANEKDFWPMQSGVRFPNEKCPNCEMRGICSDRPDLRDSLLVRNQLDELDFGKDSE